MGERGRGLRVAVLTRSFYPLHGLGGLERHAYDLVRHHLRDDLAIWLVTRPGGATDDARQAAWSSLQESPRFTCTFVPYATFPFAGRKGTTILDRSTAYPVFGRRVGAVVADAVKRGEVDLVYALGATGWGYARARRRGATAPLVLNPQGLEEFGGIEGEYGGQRLKRVGYAPLRRVVRATADAADVVLATDRALEPMLARHLAVCRPKLRLVPNAIDVAACRSLAGVADGVERRKQIGVGPEDVLVLSVGRLEVNKGFHHLATALGTWRAHPNWRWVLVGDGPAAGAITETVQSAGIAARVSRVGRVSDRELHAWYEAADLFVHPTVYEGSSLVTLEAMAHEKPVLATRAGGLPDKVRPGVTGWLVPPGDASALVSGLDDAMNARAEWAAMGAAGRRLAEQEFDWPVVERALVSIYGELLGAPTEQAPS